MTKHRGEGKRTDPTVEPRIGIWGTFDLANFGDLLFPRIFEREIHRRLPGATVRSFSPLGFRHPVPLDGGFVAEPLGEWSPKRIAELSDDLDLVAIGGGEIIHAHDEYYGIWYDVDGDEAERLRPSRFFIEGLGAELEAVTPVAWHSVGIPFDLEGELAARVRAACSRREYVSVRDELSRARLVRAGVERDIPVVPDSAVLIDRLFPPELLERRLRYLRAVGAFPEADEPLVVQGSRNLLPHVAEIAEALAEVLSARDPVSVLLLETGPCHGDGEFADALASLLPVRSYRLSEGFVVEDLVAAISHSRGFVGISLHGSLTAFAYGIPFSILNLQGYSKLDAFARMAGAEATLVTAVADLRAAVGRVLDRERARGDIASLVREVDDHFDRLAERAERSTWQRREETSSDGASGRALRRELDAGERRYRSLRAAYEARGRILVYERLRLSKRIENYEGGAELRRLRDELGHVQAELARAQGASGLIRYTAPIRRRWARIRDALSRSARRRS